MKKSSQIIGLTLIIAGLLILWYIPQLQVNQLNISIHNTVERANLENQYRVTIIQTVCGFLVIAWLFFTYERIMTLKNSQVTEQFTNAIELLEKDQLELRLGGIYALERIANESESDYWPIMEILTAYIRNNSSAKIVENNKITSLSMDIQANERIMNKTSEIRDTLSDIQAILTVIQRRKYSFNHGETNNLNLQGTTLPKTNLFGANLCRADLCGADLSGTNLSEADLSGADLCGADLSGTNLSEADLSGADLSEADLSGADLSGTDLSRTNLSSTYLPGASLSEAHLFLANLSGADLSEANLSGTDLSGADLSGADLSRANLSNALFYETNLSRAYLSKANLHRANLKGAKNLTINQLLKVKTLYNAKLDNDFLALLKEKYPTFFEKPE
jgi:uncharacterized protein YjbI with pentapeptide repeats